MGISDIIIGYGLNPMQVGVAVLVVIVGIVFLVALKADSVVDTATYAMLELHPEHVEYMKKKEEEFCSRDFGKGLRCIYDFLREEDDENVKKIMSENPKYTKGYEEHHIDVHPQQFDWLAKKGITISKEEGQEFKELSRISRACFDWAMRLEAEGNKQDFTLFENIRCLNCY